MPVSEIAPRLAQLENQLETTTQYRCSPYTILAGDAVQPYSSFTGRRGIKGVAASGYCCGIDPGGVRHSRFARVRLPRWTTRRSGQRCAPGRRAYHAALASARFPAPRVAI